ncbi:MULTISPECIES: FmdB family zinc ribbon protein [Burkholderia]|uniref:FmdB family transcriptional regulator n=1 Tax=Burkholderia mayonis TaxID=1385591 RepID=A0A1B4FGT7_9BURK|nr:MULTISPECIES: FmdB family zinc ribbon protein [Burkholderia]AOJ02890.1 FmdB family transcriptional regulator [Burkholderia mayonis]KVE45036.1 FmdB family transcriptional regulator [Burkholderia sp. BDU5]KVE48375.1 FmdB family transcriptional regulator [Burkholderia mayonis]
MPIYAYRCEACGYAKDVLQKMSDAPLSQCPECGKDAFRKQVTAAGFQLKGSGWYVTDFRGGSGGAGAPASTSAANGDQAGGEKAGGEKASAPVAADSSASAPATPAPAAAPASST